MPVRGDAKRRVAVTVAVRDTDAIPKVKGAGHVIMRDGVRLQVMHNGVVVREGSYYGEWATEMIRDLQGHHEPQEEPVFHAVVERLSADTAVPTMLELGSYWAYYSLWMKRAIPAARLILVEPDRGHLRVGLDNMGLNGVVADVVEHAAVGRSHGAQRLMPWDSDARLHRTKQLTVDGLITDHSVERIDLVVCDIQGAELDALKGAREALRHGRIRFLFVSTHHHVYSGDPLTHQRCLALLREAGAHIIAEHSISESCSGDGLIAASLDPRDTDLEVPVTIVRSRDSVFGELEWDLARRSRLRRRLASARAFVALAMRSIAAEWSG